jgi:hypothetical protein
MPLHGNRRMRSGKGEREQQCGAVRRGMHAQPLELAGCARSVRCLLPAVCCMLYVAAYGAPCVGLMADAGEAPAMWRPARKMRSAVAASAVEMKNTFPLESRILSRGPDHSQGVPSWHGEYSQGLYRYSPYRP